MASNPDIIEEEITKMEEGSAAKPKSANFLTSPWLVVNTQKVIAEVVGTYFVIFAGCGSVAVNKIYGEVTFPGVCVTWGLIVMVMIYTVGHISGAHFNPAVTITLAAFRRFPFNQILVKEQEEKWMQVPMYIIAQLVGSILASGTLALMLDITPNAYYGTVPVGSNSQSFFAEIIITFLLMFVISAISSDDRANGQLGGICVGMTILLNVFVAGPISGASMNPARSIGPAIVKHVYKGLWVYIVGPITGALLGALVYNSLRSTQNNSIDGLANNCLSPNTNSNN